MLARSGQSLVIAPFRAHPGRPVRWIFHCRGGALAFEQPAQHIRHILIGKLKVWCVGHADAENLSHRYNSFVALPFRSWRSSLLQTDEEIFIFDFPKKRGVDEISGAFTLRFRNQGLT